MADVIEVPERSRFEVYVEDRRAGVLDYYVNGDTVTLPHTEVDPAYSGQGLGGELVAGALDTLRERGLVVRPACSFVSHYIAGHPEYQDLVKGA